jgi:RHS repeat-associated protein
MNVEQVNSSTGAVEYLHHDQQGSTRLLTNGAGEAVGKCSYAAYGSPSCEGSATTPLGYDGQYTEAETGLQYLRAREYEPGTGQFVSSDPLGGITWERYNSAGDNPLNAGDPSGLLFGIELPSLSEVGSFVGTYWRPIASTALNVATITACAVPVTAGGCPAYIAANGAAQSALIATGPGSPGFKAALIGGTVLLTGGAALPLPSTSELDSLEALESAYTPPGWVGPYLATRGAALSLLLSGVELANALGCT